MTPSRGANAKRPEPLARLNTSFVLGYHGCEKSLGMKAVNGEVELLKSKGDFDWLGPGVYIWEADPRSM